MKRKTMTMMLCLLCTLALVSVGFASWVISTSTTVQQEGNIVVETVSDKRVNVIVSFLDGDENDNKNKIVFGRPASYTNTQDTDWLVNDDLKGNNVENFTLTFKVTITDKKNTPIKLDTSNNDILKFEFALDDSDKYNQLTKYEYSYTDANLQAQTVTKELVTAINDSNPTITSTYVDEGNYYKVEVKFGDDQNHVWGSAFNNENPYVYYNKIQDTSLTDVVVDEAKALLEKLAELNTMKYTFKVTAKKVTADKNS